MYERKLPSSAAGRDKTTLSHVHPPSRANIFLRPNNANFPFLPVPRSNARIFLSIYEFYYLHRNLTLINHGLYGHKQETFLLIEIALCQWIFLDLILQKIFNKIIPEDIRSLKIFFSQDTISPMTGIYRHPQLSSSLRGRRIL
jgi:hypothetical protein